MRLSVERCVLSLTLLLLVGVRTGAQDLAEMLEGVRVPVEQHENGVLKTQVTADKARMLEGGNVIEGEGVLIELFDDTGQRQQVVRLERCRFDREQRLASSDSRVEMEGDGVKVSGKGFEWQGEKESLRILSQARVEFNLTLLDAQRLADPVGEGE